MAPSYDRMSSLGLHARKNSVKDSVERMIVNLHTFTPKDLKKVVEQRRPYLDFILQINNAKIDGSETLLQIL